MIVSGSIVSMISLSALHSGRCRLRCCLGLAGIVDRDHGWIVAAGVLAQVGDLADGSEAGIAPEVALDKTDIMNSGTGISVCCDSSMELAYNVAPMANGVPRKTGMTCSSFLYGTEGPSRGGG